MAPLRRTHLSRRTRNAIHSHNNRLNETEQERRQRLEANRIRTKAKYYTDMGEKIKKRLINARVAYIKYLRATNNDTTINYYNPWQWEAHNMEFLNPCLSFAKTFTDINKSEMPDNIDDFKSSNLLTEEYLTESSTSQCETISPMDNIFNCQSTYPVDEQDALERIFMRFAKTVKKFTPKRQAAVKMKIAQIVMANELEHVNELAAMEQHHTGSAMQASSNHVTENYLKSTSPASKESVEQQIEIDEFTAIDNVQFKEEYDYEGKFCEEDPLTVLTSETPVLKVKTELEEVKEENSPVYGADVPVVIKIEQIEVKDESQLSAYDDNITIEESCINQQIRNTSAMHKSNLESEPVKMKKHKMRDKGNTEPESLLARENLQHTNTTFMMHKENDGKALELSINSDDYSQTNVKPYICNECNRCYDNKILFIAHIREHSNKTRYKCDVCLKYFIDRDTLNKHHYLHNKVKPYKCDICMKYFGQKKHLNVHRRIHTGDKLYKCDVCMKTFNKKYNFTRHIRIHNGKKPYACDVCSKCFSEKSYLNIHYRIHTGNQPYKCDVCMKHFNSKYNFTKHCQIHTGDKTYKCDVCMKCFNEKSNLDVHYRIHTGDKPYKCQVCMKCFTQKGHLDVHYRMHTGKLLYHCDTCAIGFKHKSSIIKHISKRICGKKLLV